MDEDKIDKEEKGTGFNEDSVDYTHGGEDEISYKEKRNWFHLYLKVLAIITVVCMFGGIATIWLYQDRQWLLFVIIGWAPALLFLSIAVERIVRIIKFLRQPKQALKNVNGEVDAIVTAAKDVAAHYKSGFNSESRSHKVACISILFGFGLIMLFMFVGVMLANFFPQYKIIGFVCMGISGGGMLIFITSLVIISKRNK